MALVDSIIGAESGGLPHITQKFAAHTLIGKLLLSRRPSAVIRGVIPITVDAVNRMQLRWLLSHVGKKVLTHPRMIFGRGLSAARNRNRPAMRRVGYLGGFNFPATATRSIARAKVWDRYIDRISAIAYASISTDFGSSICPNLWGRFINGYKPSEPLAGAIYGGCH